MNQQAPAEKAVHGAYEPRVRANAEAIFGDVAKALDISGPPLDNMLLELVEDSFAEFVCALWDVWDDEEGELEGPDVRSGF